MVPEIKKILYLTDMSETSNHAFGYAASLANRYDALITIFHVLQNPMPTSENLVTNVIGNSKWQGEAILQIRNPNSTIQNCAL